MDGRLDGRMEGRMIYGWKEERWMEVWMEGWKEKCELAGFEPGLGASSSTSGVSVRPDRPFAPVTVNCCRFHRSISHSFLIFSLTHILALKIFQSHYPLNPTSTTQHLQNTLKTPKRFWNPLKPPNTHHRMRGSKIFSLLWGLRTFFRRGQEQVWCNSSS